MDAGDEAPRYVYKAHTPEEYDKAMERIRQEAARFRRHDEAIARSSEEFRRSLRVGDILYSSWGWEQTNIDFYQVIAIRGSAVDLRQLDQRITEDGYMCGTTVPLPDVFKSKTHTHRQQGCKSSSYKICTQFYTQKSKNYNIFLDSSFRIFLPQQIAILSYK